MDTQRFDGWAKRLAPADGSRRGALRLALGAGAAILAGGGFAGEALAACRNDGRSCKRNGQCCSGKCMKGRRGKRTCRPAPGAFGCKITQDTCRFPDNEGLFTCPQNANGICFGLNNGQPFCARGAQCVACNSDAQCTQLAGGVPGHCVTGCNKCDESGGQVCVYPRLVDITPASEDNA